MNRAFSGERSCVIWKANVGRIHSKNRILVDQDRVVVGTCGHHWNVDDDEDGVSLLDTRTGEVIWFTQTRSDVNSICRAGMHLLCPTDRGEAFLLNAALGTVSGVFKFDSALLSRPIAWHCDEEKWEALAISAVGTVYRIGPTPRDITVIGNIGKPVRADLVDISSESGRAFIAATESGDIIKCAVSDKLVTFRVLGRIMYSGHAYSIDDPEENTKASVHAAPAIEEGRLYIGFARNSYYETAPLVCLDMLTGEEVWRASRLPHERCGNCRVTPLVIGPYVVCAFAYSNSLYLFDKENGKCAAAIKLGRHVYQQWSSPIRHGTHGVLLGRIDGRLSILDLNAKELVASISLATRKIRLGPLDDAECNGEYPLYPGRRPLGICGTPTLLRDNVFVGTTSGELFAIDIASFGGHTHESSESACARFGA